MVIYLWTPENKNEEQKFTTSLLKRKEMAIRFSIFLFNFIGFFTFAIDVY